MKCTLKTAIDCVHYRDYDGSCDRNDQGCCRVMGNNSLRNLVDAMVNEVLEKQVLEIARLNIELAKATEYQAQAAMAFEENAMLRAMCKALSAFGCGHLDCDKPRVCERKRNCPVREYREMVEEKI